jgi:hypothetical protein
MRSVTGHGGFAEKILQEARKGPSLGHLQCAESGVAGKVTPSPAENFRQAAQNMYQTRDISVIRVDASGHFFGEKAGTVCDFAGVSPDFNDRTMASALDGSCTGRGAKARLEAQIGDAVLNAGRTPFGVQVFSSRQAQNLNRRAQVAENYLSDSAEVDGALPELELHGEEGLRKCGNVGKIVDEVALIWLMLREDAAAGGKFVYARIQHFAVT